ncbi:hypothetical protein [Pseudolysinimonas yzui]|uniref:7-cyano-7-deazaguanine synthase n=1 Tax=Pseudolysinimonas yzui TaxID=2708254 RepID=A0A8J3GPL7_9MICO|nr:hypothetical protein [Pseudolysinimonas yzui]GHF12516.1 hypothetical protein GCM10011600_11610 [Pseudolysinimonas yzui]
MTRLTLNLDAADPVEGFDEVFLWDGGAEDSFKTRLDPALMALGPVPALNADFIYLALAAYAADHSVKRQGGGTNWNSRALELSVPVSDPAAWSNLAGDLGHVVGFLTGDDWTFEFRQLTAVTRTASLVGDQSERVVLFSGGADSGTGALLSALALQSGETQTLVSHASASAASSPQTTLSAALEALSPGTQAAHHAIFLSRKKRRLDGTLYASELSNRSRSLLFLALGLGVAAQSGAPLRIPENGFASLNPPLGPERLGSLSTRTTQPWFLWRLSETLASIGTHALIENPFQLITKGEMFAEVKTRLGATKASKYLSETNSCSHTNQQFARVQKQDRVASGTHCGVCFGCIVRRASFRAGKVTDRTPYLSENPVFAEYVANNTVLEATRDFAFEPISTGTILSMPLPPNISVTQAMDLCVRGQAEIRSFVQ